MTYEEKLELVINEIAEAKKRSRDGKQAYIYVTKQSDLIKKMIPQEVHEFLLKLQDNDHILQVTDVPSELKGALNWDIEKSDHFSFLISDVFEEWYESFIIRKESSLKNQTYLNLLRIFDTMLNIREVIQLHNTTTVQIPFLPQRIRFRELMLQDDAGMRDEFIQGRWDAVIYLHSGGKIKHYKHIDSMMHRWDDTIQVTINASSFYPYLEKVKQEVTKRLESKEVKRQKQSNNGNIDSSEKTTQDNKSTKIARLPWPEDYVWNGNEFCFGKVAKIPFTSPDRKHIFKTLTDKKGDWATIKELKGEKDSGYVRTTIKQIEDRLPSEVKKMLKIVSTQDDDAEDKPKMGAYRIKLLHS